MFGGVFRRTKCTISQPFKLSSVYVVLCVRRSRVLQRPVDDRHPGLPWWAALSLRLNSLLFTGSWHTRDSPSHHFEKLSIVI